MKNILYLSYDGMTDPLGQSQVLPYIIGLSAQGYRFTLISFEKPERFAQHQKTIQAICNTGVGDTDQIVLKYQSGDILSSFDNNSYKSIADTFQPQHFNPETLHEGAIEYFELHQGVEQYLEVYGKVIQ